GVAAGGGGVGDDLYWAPADATSISDARTASFRIRLSFMADSLPYRYPFDRQVRVAPLVPTALEGESILEAVSLEDRDGETGGLLGVAGAVSNDRLLRRQLGDPHRQLTAGNAESALDMADFVGALRADVDEHRLAGIDEL